MVKWITVDRGLRSKAVCFSYQKGTVQYRAEICGNWDKRKAVLSRIKKAAVQLRHLWCGEWSLARFYSREQLAFEWNGFKAQTWLACFAIYEMTNMTVLMSILVWKFKALKLMTTDRTMGRIVENHVVLTFSDFIRTYNVLEAFKDHFIIPVVTNNMQVIQGGSFC